MPERYDFSGWATRNDIKCSDGRTIRRNAFKDQNGKTVPLVWMHQHNTPENVLGHAVLENRKEGVYAYCTFNDTESGQIGKQLVAHKDIVGLSIYANQLKQSPAKDVVHGMIREVSLVIAGANPGATIDAVLAHGEMVQDAMVVETVLEHDGLDYDDGEIELKPLYEDDEDEDIDEAEFEEDEESEEDEEPAEHADKTVGEVFDEFTDEQKTVVYAMIGQALRDAGVESDDEDEDIEEDEEVEHSDDSDRTVGDVFDEFTDEQKTVVYALIGQALEDAGYGDSVEHADKEDSDEEDEEGDSDMAKEKTVKEVFDTLTEEQKTVVYALIGQAIEDARGGSDDEEEDMKHNIFDSDNESGNVLTHADKDAIVANAKRYGSLKDAYTEYVDENFLQHDDDEPAAGPGITYGIGGIDVLFPDARRVMDEPFMLKRDDGWVSKFLNGARHTPFSRIKSLYADITADDARAKGYIKSHEKTEEVFPMFKRVTTPTTVYKKQKLDRDDLIDIDFDMIPWLKSEMRVLLNEEIARAALVGDGRSNNSDDKINEQNIRPIYKDTENELYAFHVAVAKGQDDDATAKAFIRAVIKARKDYHGTGRPVLFCTEDMLTNMLLLEDGVGRALYESEAALATKLRVREIVPVEVMSGVTRTASGNTFDLAGIVVNPADYTFGADKGGAVNLFDDFDIDFNQMKYLIETRCSGALTVPKSAMIVEVKYTTPQNNG